MAGTTKDDRNPSEKTYPCRICGRNFVKSSLVKHEPACKKLTMMQRKIFDSGKQRAQNSDIPYKAVKKAAQEKEKYGGVFPRPKTHWRERHEEFIGAVTASKQVEHALKTGAPLPPPPKTSVPSDYVNCEYCGRNFNQTAAERHIPFCKEQHNGRRRTSTDRTRSNSTGRVLTSKSVNASASRSGSSRTPSRGQSPGISRSATGASRQQQRTSSGKSPASRRSSGRQPTSATIPPTANGGARVSSTNTASANSTHRASGLPTPTKRSRSASRTSRTGSATKSPKTPSSKSKTPKPKTPGISRTASSTTANGIGAPRTPGIPRTASSTTANGIKVPKTPKPKTPSSKPKTPKRPKSRSPPSKSSIFSLSSLTGFAIAAPLTQSSKQRDKSPIKNGQPKSSHGVTTGSFKKR